MRAHKNPLSTNETIAFVAAAGAVAAVVVAVVVAKKSAAAPARTPNALDNYRLVISSTTALPAANTAALTATIQAFPGFGAATVTSIVQSADMKTVTVGFLAPPVSEANMQAWQSMQGPQGSSYDLSDVGVSVQ